MSHAQYAKQRWQVEPARNPGIDELLHVRIVETRVELVIEDLEDDLVDRESSPRTVDVIGTIRGIDEIEQRPRDVPLRGIRGHSRVGASVQGPKQRSGQRSAGRAIDLRPECPPDRLSEIRCEPFHPRKPGTLGVHSTDHSGAAVVLAADAHEARDVLLEIVPILVECREVVHRKRGIEP